MDLKPLSSKEKYQKESDLTEFVNEIADIVSSSSFTRPVTPSPDNFPPNPFTETLAIRDCERFIGRKNELRRLMAMLQGGSVSLNGDPKIGKSSLLWYLERNWPGKVLGPIDFLGIEDRDDFFEHLAEELELAQSSKRAIREKLKNIQAILLLDELDAAPDRGITSSDLDVFRSACDYNRSLKLVSASRNPLKTLYPDTGSSPLFNILQPLSLEPLATDEAYELLSHPWAPDAPQFKSYICDELVKAADTHPFKLQRAAFHYYQSLTAPSYTWQKYFNQDMEYML